MIAVRFGGLDEGLVSRDRWALREKIETEPKIRKWFHDQAKYLSPDSTASDRPAPFLLHGSLHDRQLPEHWIRSGRGMRR
jgi:hypothetical protein